MDLTLYIILSIVCVFTLVYILTGDTSKKMPQIPFFFAGLLSILLVYEIAFYPVDIYSDKWIYLDTFKRLSWADVSGAKDVGWAVYVYLCKSLFNNPEIFFLITALVYISGYWVFASRYFSASYIYFFILAIFISFGFIAYGVNTLRAGFSLSILLMAFAFQRKKILFILLAAIAVLCHKSMILPLAAFLLTRYYKNYKFFLSFWVVCLLVSYINIGFITETVKVLLSENEERIAGYFSRSSLRRYNVGFRIDFVLYSMVPIGVGLYYMMKLKLEDSAYLRLFNTYLLVNGVWLLAIRMAFTDRIAYLSWFLMPFLILYPLLKYQLPLNQRKWVFIVLLGIFTFSSIMFFK